MNQNGKFFAFLRGINVGGHHKVPMADLRQQMGKMGFTGVKTFLNSGNVVFEGLQEPISTLENKIADHLEKTYGFSIPVIVRKAEDMRQIIADNPFRDVQVHKAIRLYITFLKGEPNEKPNIPYISDDGGYQITAIWDKMVCSKLDLSKTKTPNAMGILEKWFGKNITTRNWDTIIKMAGN